MTAKKAATSEDQPEEAPEEDQPSEETEPTEPTDVPEVSTEAPQTQRQMVPPQVTDKGKKYPSDPNWYPDPDKPLPRSF